MLDLTKIPEAILNDIKEMDVNPEKLTPREALDKYLTYNGIIGHTEMILNAWKVLQNAEANTTHESIEAYRKHMEYPE